MRRLLEVYCLSVSLSQRRHLSIDIKLLLVKGLGPGAEEIVEEGASQPSMLWSFVLYKIRTLYMSV